jgi:hypothetical protein
MLTQMQVLALHRSLRNERVLSVYIDGSATDPAVQRAWRLQLEHSIADLRKWLDGSPQNERAQFERCVSLLDAAIAGFDPGIGSPGWAAFITSAGVREAHPLPVPAPTLAVWSTGPSLAPYVRALKENHPVVVVVADARRATIYQYRVGKLDRVETVRAHHAIDRPTHMGTPARQGFHVGTRGTAGHDSAQRELLSGRDRMLAETVDRIGALAGDDGWILVGGIKRVVARLMEQLAPIATHRAREVGSLDVHASEAIVAEVARVGASALRNEFDARRLDDIANEAGAHGSGALGPSSVRLALDNACVRELYVTHGYVENHAAEAEAAVRIALEQDAAIEEVSGKAAERLDKLGGMAAGLRFRPAMMDSVPV